MKKYKYNKSFRFNGKVYSVKGNTLEEVELKKARKLAQLKTEVVDSSLTVRKWGERAVKLYKTRQNQTTRNSYMCVMRKHIFTYIGDMRLKDVKPQHLQETLNHANNLSDGTIRKVKEILTFIFAKAVENDLLSRNPCLAIVSPKGYTKERRAITSRERETLVKLCETDPRYEVFLAMLKCGCRPTEAMNLTSDDIEFMSGKPMLHIRGTKTKNSDRRVPLPQTLYELVKDRKGLLFTNNGKPWNRGTYNLCSKRLKTHMNDNFVPYCFRHTYCTNLALNHVDVRQAQKLMGHANISITVDIYTHLEDSVALEVYDIINAM